MYFYSNKDNSCPDCEREGFVLTRLREDYPELRVYSFDYNLDLSALQTLISIYNIKPTGTDNLPAILINNNVYYGFKSVDDVKSILPALKQLDKQHALDATKQASSTEPN
jgi:hypothetical protein